MIKKIDDVDFACMDDMENWLAKRIDEMDSLHVIGILLYKRYRFVCLLRMCWI